MGSSRRRCRCKAGVPESQAGLPEIPNLKQQIPNKEETGKEEKSQTKRKRGNK
jgi:hypothetical protein